MLVVILRTTRVEEKVLGHPDEFCPLHGDLHRFEFVADRRTTRVGAVPVDRGPLTNHRLRTTLPCRHVRPADPGLLTAPPAGARWRQRLDLEQQLRVAPSSVPVATRQALLHELVGHLDAGNFGSITNAEIGRGQAGPLLAVCGVLFASNVLALALGRGEIVGVGLVAMFVGIVALAARGSRDKKRVPLATDRFVVGSVLPRFALDAHEQAAVLERHAGAGSPSARRLLGAVSPSDRLRVEITSTRSPRPSARPPARSR